MTTMTARLQAVRERIRSAAQTAGRRPHDVTLLAVSKTFSAEIVAEACALGQRDFGESYLQEATGKIGALQGAGLCGHAAQPYQGEQSWVSGLRPTSGVVSPQAGPLFRPLVWHFIGPIQSNKTRPIAELFQWVHGVDRLKIAERLSSARPAHLPALDICIQVNVSGEASKGGVPPAQATDLAHAIAGLPGLRLRGLMGIPEPTADVGLQRARFRQVRELKDAIVAGGIPMDTLSMGMSDDLEAAIAEGSTLVRVGRAIFGERPRREG